MRKRLIILFFAVVIMSVGIIPAQAAGNNYENGEHLGTQLGQHNGDLKHGQYNVISRKEKERNQSLFEIWHKFYVRNQYTLWIDYLTKVRNEQIEAGRIEAQRISALQSQQESISESSSSGVAYYAGKYRCWQGCIRPTTACVLPSYICGREALFIDVQNPGGSACGKYQFISSTWNGYGGYSNACLAPEYVQNQKALDLWDNGNGCSHWSAC